QGDIRIEQDGTVREDKAAVGTLKLVDFAPGAVFERDGGSRFSTTTPPKTIEKPSFTSGTLAQSNVARVERFAGASAGSRNYQTLLKAVQVLMNDVDRNAIMELGRK